MELEIEEANEFCWNSVTDEMAEFIKANIKEEDLTWIIDEYFDNRDIVALYAMINHRLRKEET